MKPENWHIALILMIFIGVLGCRKNANIIPNEYQPKLVVNSVFTHDEQMVLNVSSSKNYDEVDPFLNDLNVDLFSHQFTKKANIGYGNPPYLSTDFFPDHNYTGFYHINVSAEGYDTVYAVTKIPKPIIASATKVGVRELYNSDVDIIEVQITDDPTEDNFYMINTWLFKFNTTTKRWENDFPRIYTLDQRTDNEIFTQNSGGLYSNIYLAEKNVERDSAFISSTVYVRNGANIDTLGVDSILLQVRIRSVEEDFYKHALNIEQYDQQLLAQPGFEKQYIKVHSNVTNGLGIFAGYSEKTFNFQVYP